MTPPPVASVAVSSALRWVYTYVSGAALALASSAHPLGSTSVDLG
jgi:hypothetical protein